MDGYYDYHPQVHLKCPMALVGLASGPTRRLGHWIAATEGLPLLDLDRHIEHAAGRSLWSLVAEHGEAAYRQLEREALRAALRSTPVGIIVGGDGLALDPDNEARLYRETHWVAITASPHQLARAARRDAHETTGFWHPTRREVLLDVAQVATFRDARLASLRRAHRTIDLGAHDRRTLRERVRAELPLAA